MVNGNLPGLATFPLFPVVDGRCGCGDPTCETKPGKHPAYTYSKLVAGESWPVPEGFGVGIATGTRSGVIVIDLDSEEAIQAFEAMGPCAETFTVRTSRGVHLYFRQPHFLVKTIGGRKDGQWPPFGIDIRGEGGFAVAPGSKHKSGFVYDVLIDTPPIDAPDWLLELLEEARSPKDQGAGANAPIPIDATHSDWTRRLELAREHCQTAPPSIEGQRGGTAMLLVCRYLVRSLELPLDVCAEIIAEHFNPRCVPNGWTGSELWHKLYEARDRLDGPTGVPSEGWDLTAAAQRPARAPEPAAQRMRKDPAHVYTFRPGDVPNGDKTKRTFANVIADLVQLPAWDGVWQYNEFDRKVYAVNPPMELDAERGSLTDEDAKAVVAWFEVESQYLITPDAAMSAIVQAAKRNKYHPVREYLQGLPVWSGISCVPQFAKALGAVGGALAEDVLRKTLVSAVRRVMQPGSKVDTMLVLYGGQGAGKTSMVSALFGEEYTRSQMPDLANKDASEALNGFWAIELAELDRILRAEMSTVKEFLSRTFDDYRPPYGKCSQRYPRACVFVGTTNMDTFLRDSTGDRRFWPLEVGDAIDIPWIVANRDALWAEALALHMSGEAHWFKDETEITEARAQFSENDPWQDLIADYLTGRETVRSAEDVYLRCIARGDADAAAKMDKRVRDRVGNVLRMLGCERCVRWVDNKSIRVWSVPDNVRLAAPSDDEVQRRVIDGLAARARQPN